MTVESAPPRTTHHSACPCGNCRRQNAQRCDGTGRDHRCGETKRHRHCCCGLSMPVNAEMCEMCWDEGAEPTDYDELVWDGESYGSFRRRRTTAPSNEVYIRLFAVAHDRAAMTVKALR